MNSYQNQNMNMRYVPRQASASNVLGYIDQVLLKSKAQFGGTSAFQSPSRIASNSHSTTAFTLQPQTTAYSAHSKSPINQREIMEKIENQKDKQREYEKMKAREKERDQALKDFEAKLKADHDKRKEQEKEQIRIKQQQLETEREMQRLRDIEIQQQKQAEKDKQIEMEREARERNAKERERIEKELQLQKAKQSLAAPISPFIPAMLKQTQNNTVKRPSERFPNYLIRRKLGDGQYGEVFLATHVDTGFPVALKVVKKTQIIANYMEEQLAWEIKIQYLSQHPNIVKLYTFFQTSTEIVMVLEYCHHGHLFAQLQKQPNRRFTEREAANYVRQITNSLVYLHNNDILHRDIKPENILLSFGQAKLADFSFCVYSPHEYRQTQCGTLLYASPEIIDGDMYDKRSDMWGLGVLTYELCFGVPPWKENQQEQIRMAQFLVPSAASKELKDFIQQLVKKSPKDRLSAKQALNHPWLAQAQESVPFFIKRNEALFK